MRSNPLKSTMTPSQLHAFTAAGLVAAAALKVRLDDMQDVADETRYPTVPYDAPAWFVEPRDFATWELGPAVPADVCLVPPAPTDAELAAFWPGSDS
jgi:hypothetical protein